MIHFLISAVCLATIALALFVLRAEIVRIRRERQRRRQDFLREIERRCAHV